MAEVALRIGDQTLVSIITRSSAERLGLKVGDEVFAVIKSTEVMIGKRSSHERARSPRGLTVRPRLTVALALATLAALAMPWRWRGRHPPRRRARRALPTLVVFAAASLAEAFTELGARFERTHPGLAVRFNFAGSQQLAAQIDQGAAADVFASADERWMARRARARPARRRPVTFARNRLVVIVPRTNPGPHREPARPRARRRQAGARRRRGAGGPLRATAAAEPRARAGLGADFARRALRNVVSEEENVKSRGRQGAARRGRRRDRVPLRRDARRSRGSCACSRFPRART